MSSFDVVENLSSSFHWAGKAAVLRMKESLKKDTYIPGFEARIFFAAQAVSSSVAIPFTLISSFFIMLWNVGHGEIKEAFLAGAAAASFSTKHLCLIFSSPIASLTPLNWTNKALDYFQYKPLKIKPQSSIEIIENLSASFLWAAKAILPLMKKSLSEKSCKPAIEIRLFFISQVISSMVAIPFILISSFYILLWNLIHFDGTEAFTTIPAALIFTALHVSTIFASSIATVAPLIWTDKSLDCFHYKRPEILQLNLEA